jgi:phenylalanyl-tRNA synthetase beta chain
MKVSLNWVKQYLDYELPPIDELVERIGAQLGAVEEVENLGERYQGILVAKVMECVDHQDSDHLHVCKIDDGGKAQDVERDENGYVQVVCGASNVREGLMVAWLPPGSTVPESVGKDPFVLGKRELRGVVSNGMLASPKELALGESHEGILELDGDAKPGDDFAEVYGLDDYVIDIENKMFTHRPDCFGVLGVAREICGISGKRFISPDWYLRTEQKAFEVDGEVLPLEVRNEVPALVPRFLVVPMSNVTIKPSPVWLQTYLLRSGVRPINNVVDITNYMMLLTGQPMHAYDYDKVKAEGGGIGCLMVVRHPKRNEEVELLNGKTIQPRDEAILIATATKPIGVGGVMGGATTEVDENTKNIILECATFDMYSIRRTSMAHGLFTDAVSRFNKGQSPLQNDEISAKTVEMLRELADAKVSGPVIDNNHVDEESRHRRWVHPPVPVATEFINARLGFDLAASDIQRLLGNVECSVTADGDRLLVTAPFWRTDIETREDVVEEVGRLYGFDKLPLELPKRSIKPAPKDPLFELKSKVRATLSKAGANEILTYSFVHGDLLQKVGQDQSRTFQIGNALSPDLQYYRLSLTPSLLEKVHGNVKAGFGSFAVFEIGKSHYLGEMDANESDIPNEDDHVALVLTYDNKKRPNASPYYQVREYLNQIVDQTNVTIQRLSDFDISTDEWGGQLVAPYEPGRSAVLLKDNKVWGVVGEFKPSVRRALKLPDYSAGFEVHADLVAHKDIRYVQLSRFPKVTQDLTLKVQSGATFESVSNTVTEALENAQADRVTYSLRPLGIYQADTDKEHKNITFRLEVASYQKTLTDKEVNGLLDMVVAAAHDKLGAERV